MIRKRLLEKGEYDGDVQGDDEFEILKAFHESDPNDFNIWKKHNPYDIGLRIRSNKAGILMSDYTMKGRCRYHRTITDDRPYSVYDHSLEKTHKKREMTRAGGDFALKDVD